MMTLIELLDQASEPYPGDVHLANVVEGCGDTLALFIRRELTGIYMDAEREDRDDILAAASSAILKAAEELTDVAEALNPVPYEPPPQFATACPVCAAVHLDRDDAAFCCHDERKNDG